MRGRGAGAQVVWLPPDWASEARHPRAGGTYARHVRITMMKRLGVPVLVAAVLAACGSAGPSNSNAPPSVCVPIRVTAQQFFDAGPTALGAPPKLLVATATDASGKPLQGIAIEFQLTGHDVNNGSTSDQKLGSSTTDGRGIATFGPDGLSMGSGGSSWSAWTALHPADSHCSDSATATYTKQP